MLQHRFTSRGVLAIAMLAVSGVSCHAWAQSINEDDRGAESPSLRLALKDLLEQQPPATDPATPAPGRARTATSSRSTYARLARAPNMFGDAQLLFRTITPDGQTQELPTIANFGANSAGARKIGENDKSLPMDRVFFVFNHFTNAQTPLASVGPVPPVVSDVSRCTFGVEKTFFDGWWSAEARLSLSNSIEASLLDTQFDGGVPGTVTLYLKNLFYDDGTTGIGAGMGFALPCSSDVMVTSPDLNLRFREQATHLMPYIGFVSMPTDEWFVNGFLQLDFASGNDRLDSLPSGRPEQPIGRLPQQHILFADVSVGRWLFQDDSAPFLTGLAAAIELHYLTTLNDSETVQAVVPLSSRGGVSTFTLSNFANRVDVLNLTAGLQFQLGDLSSLRVAGVVPLTQDFNQLFDSELQIVFNRLF